MTNIFRSLFYPSRRWMLVFFFFVLSDILIYSLHTSATRFEVTIYTGSLLLSFLFFALLENIRVIIPAFLRSIYSITVSFILAFIFLSSVFVYLQFGEYITVAKVQFILRNPEYVKSFLRTFLFNINMLGFILIWGFICWLWIGKRDKGRYSFYKRVISVLILLLLFLILLNQLNYYGKNRRVTMDTSLAIAIKDINKLKSAQLMSSKRTSVEQFQLTDSLDVIIIINESFGRKAFSCDTTNRNSMPFLKKWCEENADFCFIFEHAYTNSGATDISVPSILSGVAPYESMKKLHEVPLIWDWARAASMKTILYSAQTYRWANFRTFFMTPGPDVFLSPDELNLPLMYDTGIDEIIAVKHFCSFLASEPRQRRILAVYNSNALHFPFQQESPLLQNKPAFASRYDNSASILDEGLNLLRESLEKSHRMDNTLIIITSDHGETDSLTHSSINRLYNFYDEIVHIPMIIMVPPRLKNNHPDAFHRLQQNRKELVSNLDIVPTVIQMLGGTAPSFNHKLASSLHGVSLIEPIPPGHFVITLNTNDLRYWDHEGFSIVSDSKHFIFTDIENEGLYDTKADPLEQHNLWLESNKRDKIFFNTIIDTIFHLKRIYGER